MTISDAKILNHYRRQRFQDHLRHLKTRQGAFDAACLHFDHTSPGSHHILEPSDCGKSAAQIRNNCEETPLWLKLWRISVKKLPPTGRKVLSALMIDWRTSAAAKIAGVSTASVKRYRTFFKMHFAQCFRAWKRDFGT